MTRAALAAAALSLAAAGAAAQEFSRHLRCTGELAVPGSKAQPAHADFALRFNNRTALIQRSNVLPVGERLRYTPTPALYSMTYQLPVQGTQIVALPGWFQHTVLVVHPDLQRLNRIRISIDRQTGALQGVVANERDEALATFGMQCESMSEQDVGAPKF